MNRLDESGDACIDCFRLLHWFRLDHFMRWDEPRKRDDIEGIPRRGGGGHSDRPHDGHFANLGTHAVKDFKGRAVVAAGRLKVAVNPTRAGHVDEGEFH